jgi:hypothetical protein
MLNSIVATLGCNERGAKTPISVPPGSLKQFDQSDSEPALTFMAISEIPVILPQVSIIREHPPFWRGEGSLGIPGKQDGTGLGGKPNVLGVAICRGTFEEARMRPAPHTPHLARG